MKEQRPAQLLTDETKQALMLAWLIMSAALLLILTAPHVLPADTVLTASALLRQPHHGQEQCPLCGMTRAFIAISHGSCTRALALNKWSVPLYAALLFNQLCAALFLAGRIQKFFDSHKTSGFPHILETIRGHR